MSERLRLMEPTSCPNRHRLRRRTSSSLYLLVRPTDDHSPRLIIGTADTTVGQEDQLIAAVAKIPCKKLNIYESSTNVAGSIKVLSLRRINLGST